MSPSDVLSYASLIDKGGVVVVLVALVLALSAAVRWLLKLLLDRQDHAISYREQQLQQLRTQLDRQQDLFDQALDMLREEASARRGGAGRSR